MSPTKRRTERWLQEHTPQKHGRGLDLRKVREGGIGRRNGRDQRKRRSSFWNFTLWFSGKKSPDGEDGEDYLEGDTVVEDGGSAVVASGYDNDLTLVVGDYDEGVRGDETARTSENYNDRYLNYDDPRVQEWTEEETWLFTKFTNRGYEPLLHSGWIMDYPTFPDQLFTNDKNQVYIRNIHSSTGRGMHYIVASSPSTCS